MGGVCHCHIVVGIEKRLRAALTLPIGRSATATATATDTAAATLQHPGTVVKAHIVFVKNYCSRNVAKAFLNT